MKVKPAKAVNENESSSLIFRVLRYNNNRRYCSMRFSFKNFLANPAQYKI